MSFGFTAAEKIFDLINLAGTAAPGALTTGFGMGAGGDLVILSGALTAGIAYRKAGRHPSGGHRDGLVAVGVGVIGGGLLLRGIAECLMASTYGTLGLPGNVLTGEWLDASALLVFAITAALCFIGSLVGRHHLPGQATSQ
jgi:hypothetical protein